MLTGKGSSMVKNKRETTKRRATKREKGWKGLVVVRYLFKIFFCPAGSSRGLARAPSPSHAHATPNSSIQPHHGPIRSVHLSFSNISNSRVPSFLLSHPCPLGQTGGSVQGNIYPRERATLLFARFFFFIIRFVIIRNGSSAYVSLCSLYAQSHPFSSVCVPFCAFSRTICLSREYEGPERNRNVAYPN